MSAWIDGRFRALKLTAVSRSVAVTVTMLAFAGAHAVAVLYVVVFQDTVEFSFGGVPVDRGGTIVVAFDTLIGIKEVAFVTEAVGNKVALVTAVGRKELAFEAGPVGSSVTLAMLVGINEVAFVDAGSMVALALEVYDSSDSELEMGYVPGWMVAC
jgi:hypothetical protein